MPEGPSHIRGVGFPFHGTAVIDFTMIPPTALRSMNADPSRPAAKVPDASSTGVSNSMGPSFVTRREASSREGGISSPAERARRGSLPWLPGPRPSHSVTAPRPGAGPEPLRRRSR